VTLKIISRQVVRHFKRHFVCVLRSEWW